MIEIQNLSKMYRIYSRRSDRLREWIGFGKGKRHFEHWALRDVNLKVEKGQVLGIIGMNGAGKSTLLKILTGTSMPTSGSVRVDGRIAALLELGTGFHHEFSGRENVVVNGKLLGMSHDEILSKVESIKEFSELGEFFEQPVRTYSSGMYVRLAFSLASSVDPDVLIIDEALSVGDAYFQQKCLNRIREFKAKGTTILFVSHDPLAIRVLCDHAALLDSGQLISTGDVGELLDHYNALLARKEGSGREYIVKKTASGAYVSGNFKAEIESVKLVDSSGKVAEALMLGDEFSINVKVKFIEEIVNPTVGVLIRDRLGYDVFGTNTSELNIDTGVFRAGEVGEFKFRVRADIGPASYTVTAAAHASSSHIAECYQWVDRILTFSVLPRSETRFTGVAYLHPKVSVHRL